MRITGWYLLNKAKHPSGVNRISFTIMDCRISLNGSSPKLATNDIITETIIKAAMTGVVNYDNRSPSDLIGD